MMLAHARSQSPAAGILLRMPQAERFIDSLMATIGLPRGECEQRLRKLLPSGFRFVHPDFVAQSPEELAAVFARFSARLAPGVRVARTSAVEEHHGRFRYTWARLDGDTVLAEGADFGWTDDAGQIVEVVVFDETRPSES
jgi:hypothetical protein